ncbi:hypothetical protein BDV12DRAFT_208936 [Aspergillus spectabilis]
MSRPPQTALHFIPFDPSTNTRRSEVIREVRSHAGRWTWEHTRQCRDQGKCNAVEDEDDASNQATASSLTSNVRNLSSTACKTDSASQDLSRVSGTASRPVGHDTEKDQQHVPRHYQVENLDASIVDPFHTRVPSPIPLDAVDMNDKYALLVLWPGLMPSSPIGGIHAGVHAWFLYSQSDPTLHNAMLFGSFSHRRALIKGQGDFYARDVKNMTLSLVNSISMINKDIQNPSRALVDEVILSVLCLANNDNPRGEKTQESPFQPPLRSLQWLNIYGSLSPNSIHQAGLANLVCLKGGLEKIELPGLAAIISFSSILGASRSISQPQFPFVSLQSGIPPTLHDVINTQDPMICHGPDILLALQVPEEMQKVFYAARAYLSLVEAYVEGAPMARDTAVICDYRNLVQWHIMSLPPGSQLHYPFHQIYSTYECCRLALVIVGVGVIFPLPAGSLPRLELARMLLHELQQYEHILVASSSIDALKMHCWCVVLGGIAASGSQERKWFVHELGRLAFSMPISSWRSLHTMLSSILWLDSGCSEAGKDLWTEAMRHIEPVPPT